MSNPTNPKIDSVSISPNPVNTGASFFVSVAVSEYEITLYKVAPYSGTSNSNQTVVIPQYSVVNT